LATNVIDAGPGASARRDFSWAVRVYYEDTDTGGIVFYANYLKFFERARTEWLRASGVTQQALAETARIMFVVRSTAVDYHAPAKLDDELKLSVTVERLGRASVNFYQEAWVEENGAVRRVASGRIRVGCLGMDDFRPTPLPQHIMMKLRQALTRQ
jgi:acyl-CoA thioester hydrolase